MEQPKKKSSASLLIAGVACLFISFAGLFTAYYYSWRIAVPPKLAADAVEKYDTVSGILGISSLCVFALSLVLIGMGLWHRYRR
jgi:hypothetical protein